MEYRQASPHQNPEKIVNKRLGLYYIFIPTCSFCFFTQKQTTLYFIFIASIKYTIKILSNGFTKVCIAQELLCNQTEWRKLHWPITTTLQGWRTFWEPGILGWEDKVGKKHENNENIT